MVYKLHISLTILALCLSCIANAGWSLVYENDSSGNAVNGSLTALINDVDAGRTIRLYSGSVIYRTDRVFTQNNHVYAITALPVTGFTASSSSPYAVTYTYQSKPGVAAWATTGKEPWEIFNGASGTNNRAIKWFVKD